jgi:DNA polymerase III delta prime subunit
MLINPITKKWLDAYIARPRSAALIDTKADIKSGIETLEYINKQIVKDGKSSLNLIDLDEGKMSIGIEQIRELKKSLYLSANKDNFISRIVSILNADKITEDGQNTLLKILEELPDRTLIILVASQTKSIIDTIKSRCFIINFLPITKDQAINYGKDSFIEPNVVNSAYILSEGNANKFIEYLETNDTKSDLKIAKEFIVSSEFERQNLIKSIISDDNDLDSFIHYLLITAKTGMRQSSDHKTKIKWKNILKQIIKTQEQIEANVPKKLALMSLSVSLD